MGYFRHHAILVTDIRKAPVEHLHLLASTLLSEEETLSTTMLSEINCSPVNGFYSFVVFPDGSKEGWEESNAGDEFRATFVEHLRETYVDWCLIQYGDEEGQNYMVDNPTGN